MTAAPLRIVELRADSVKRLRAVTIRPDENGNMVVLAGENGAGKSSVLDAIAMALGGRDQIPTEPIRRGADHAEIVLDLGEIIVRRTFTASGGGQVVVQNRDGAKFGSPQTMLDKLVGKLSFDPLGFSRKKPADQSETLRELIGLDLSSIDWKHEEAFKKRTEINRSAKALQSRLDAMPEHADAPEDPVSVADMTTELQVINSRNLDNAAARRRLEAMKRDGGELRDRIERLREDLAHTEELLRQHDEHQIAAEADVQARADVDTAPLLQMIRGAEGVNRQVREKHERRNLAVEHASEVSKSEALTKLIEDLDKQRADAIAAAPMPIDGLGFDSSGGVTLNGLPLDQASAAEKLRVSVAIGIAMNPRLRVLLIRDAALLDNKSLGMVAEMARAADCQLWVERIGVDEHTTVVIEDGEATAVRSEAL